MVKGHYFINDYTELTSYCLDNYEEIKDIKDCNNIYNDIFIKAFQVFKVLIDKVDKLIAPMGLTGEALNKTQFYDNVEDYNALEHNKTNCRLDEYVEK